MFLRFALALLRKSHERARWFFAPRSSSRVMELREDSSKPRAACAREKHSSCVLHWGIDVKAYDVSSRQERRSSVVGLARQPAKTSEKSSSKGRSFFPMQKLYSKTHLSISLIDVILNIRKERFKV